MSDYDTDSDTNSDNNYDENNYDEDLEDEEEEEEPENNMMSNKYTTDGLPEEIYKKSEVRWEKPKLVRAECCQKYFRSNAYDHGTKFGLNVDGINTCIHCYFGFNVYKYEDITKLTDSEKKCLNFYTENFAKQHDNSNCDNLTQFNKCFLCETQSGVYSNSTNDSLLVDEIVDTVIDNIVIAHDVITIKKNDASDYVMIL